MSTLSEVLLATPSEAAALARFGLRYLAGIKQPPDEEIIRRKCQTTEPGDNCDRPPIVLVHGIFHNWTAWEPLMEALTARGYNHWVRFNYNALGDSPAEIAGALAASITRVKEATGSDTVHVIGHSLGGVVTRGYDRLLGGAPNLGCVATLGSPLNGTPLTAVPFMPKALKELRPGSDLVRAMTEGDDPRQNWLTIQGEGDVLVPPNYALLARSQQASIPNTGHLGLLTNPEVIDLLVAFLADNRVIDLTATVDDNASLVSQT